MLDELENLEATVAEWRKTVNESKAEYQSELDEFEKRFGYLRERFDFEKGKLAEAEKELRDAAVAAYEADPDAGKKLSDYTSIRVKDTYTYDHEEALAWSKEKGLALKLDEKAYKALMAAGTDAPGEIVKETTATISTKL